MYEIVAETTNGMTFECRCNPSSPMSVSGSRALRARNKFILSLIVIKDFRTYNLCQQSRCRRGEGGYFGHCFTHLFVQTLFSVSVIRINIHFHFDLSSFFNGLSIDRKDVNENKKKQKRKRERRKKNEEI